MKHIVSFSGGKDSTAMLLRMLEENMQVDDILFCDTGMEFPDMYYHVKQVQEYIMTNYGKEITILKPEHSFEYWMYEREKTKGKHKGSKGFGWPTGVCRWCTRHLKVHVMDKYLRKYKDEGYVEYVGIAYDELHRAKNKQYPLINWKMTEKDCLRYCYDRGFNWNGLYEHFDRLSCYCCPLQKLKHLYIVYKFYPDLWEKLRDMDNKSYNSFRVDYTFDELEHVFKIRPEKYEKQIRR